MNLHEESSSMSKINDGGPAFPESGPRGQAVGGEGMSLRDYFAIRVAAAMLTATSADRDFPNLSYRREEDGPTLAERVAAIAYTMAGAMLKARGVRELAAPKPDTVADETGVEFFAVPEGLHPNTANLVARFATALAEKLAAAERKYGYSDNWARPDWMDECRQELVEHVAKGDPRDVAAYCAFLWHHGESTAGAKPDAVAGLVEKALDRMRHAPPQLWRADLIGQQISVERMRDILAFALAAQRQEPTT